MTVSVYYPSDGQVFGEVWYFSGGGMVLAFAAGGVPESNGQEGVLLVGMGWGTPARTKGEDANRSD